MSDILLRLELHTPEQAHQAIAEQGWPYVKEQTRQGLALVAEFRLLDDAITEAQRGYLHGVVLTEAALYARPRGFQYEMKVWKEYFRAEILGFKVVTSINPLTGKKLRRRVLISTEDLGVRGLADYIDKVIAILATDFNVVVSEPLPAHLRGTRAKARKNEIIDQETGEILQGA